MRHGYILALDQGTTSSRAIIFDGQMRVVGSAQKEFAQRFPESGWVEHDPDEIWRSVVATARAALRRSGLVSDDVAAIGIANQRETVVLWDRKTGEPVYPAIVWQDRRTSSLCEALRAAGEEGAITAETGLVLDPYFSASKIAWLLDNVDGVRVRAEKGDLAFGTIDTFLIWRLTGGRVHATDATNASRTMLFDIRAGTWSERLLKLFRIPSAILPVVHDCAHEYGITDPKILGGPVPIRGLAGDQQAAAIGQACFARGMIKSTYGTGCFALINTGAAPVASANRLLTTIACQLEGKRTYALEGSIFVAGAAVQWLRDGLKIIRKAGDTAALAEASDRGQDIYMVPAFVGLGAPYWDAEARGAIFGISRATTRAELARAALEAACYQTHDLLDAMAKDMGDASAADVVRVDGGMVASDWTMQFLADVLGRPVDRPVTLETTAVGAAYLAGLASGVFPPPAEFAESWQRSRRFLPAMEKSVREKRLAGWHDAVRRTLSR
jgi:glycerol kinase